jgi:hypothetical protein
MLRVVRKRARIAVGLWSRLAAGSAMLWFTFAFGCATARQPGARESCALRSRDSTYAAGRPVYRDCAVDRPARFTNTNVLPDWRPPTSSSNSCYSVEMEFVVDEAGRVERETATVVQASDRSFANAWMTTLGEWKFEPAVRGGVRVRQIVTMKRSAQTAVVRSSSPVGTGRPPSTTERLPKC